MRNQRAVLPAPDECVERAQRFVFGGRRLELLHRHVRGVEVGSGGLRGDALDEWPVPAEPVPRPVVDLDEAPGRLVALREREGLLPVPMGLLPEDVVHRLRGLDQQAHDLAVVHGEVGKIGLQTDDRVLVHEVLHGGRAFGRPGAVILPRGPAIPGVCAPGGGERKGNEQCGRDA